MPGTRDQQRWSMEKGGGAKRLFPIKKAGCLPDPPTASPTRSGLENLVPFRGGDPWIVLGWLCRKWRRHSRGWKGWQSDRPRHEPVPLEKKNFFGRVPSCSSSSEGFARFFFSFLSYANETFGCFLNYLREFSDFNFISFSFSLWKSFEPSFRW